MYSKLSSVIQVEKSNANDTSYFVSNMSVYPKSIKGYGEKYQMFDSFTLCAPGGTCFTCKHL